MKIFDMLSHEGYHHELCKLRCDFTITVDREHRWNKRYRPIPSNVTFLDRSALSVSLVEQYDIAIIHNYKQFQLLRDCNIPKIIVMHCSKQGQGDVEFTTEDLGKYLIVFNSYKDKERWNLSCPRQHVILHGFDPSEWPVSDRSINRIFTVGRRIAERDNICGYRIIQELERSNIPVKIVGDNPTIGIQSPGDFDEFRRYHSKYAVYLNPTLRSPMPRGRGEAMMCGIPVITTNFYDEELFIENGVNGFYSNNIQQIKEYAALLLADKNLQAEMARNIYKTALEKFHISRFLVEWKKVIAEIAQVDTSSISVTRPGAPKIYVTRKDSSAGGGTITSNNVMKGLKEHGYEVKCLDINSKGWVAFVDDKKLPASSAREWPNFIKDNPCDVIVFDDIERYRLCKEHLDPSCRVLLCILGNPQVHESCWCEEGVLNLDDPNNKVEKILCRPIYAQYLSSLFGADKVISWIGGCNGEEMRKQYGTAKYKHPRDGALIISAHRGTDWWKNPTTAVLAAYGLYKRYPEMIYFKPSGSDVETKLLKNIVFDIQYGGTAKQGMNRYDLLKIMACSQLAIEPGYSEGFSRASNEIMNLGVPIIQGPNAEHIFENTFLTEHLITRNPSNIQEVITKAIALLENEELWNAVSLECIRFSSKFNVEQEVKTLIEALEGSK
jgi:glycosyltransferase involved in cell wall biosynthesis